MNQDTLNYIFIGLSFALYIGIALKSRASSTKEYYTAGGGVSPLANGMATAADWMSAATFIPMQALWPLADMQVLFRWGGRVASCCSPS